MSATVTKPKFELIDDISPASATPEATPVDQGERARKMLMIALQSLSARAMTAITNLFSLFLVALTFILFGRILDDPTPFKLGAVGGFAVFCLMIDVVRRRTR